MTIAEDDASSLAGWILTPTCMLPLRWIPSAGCSASGISRPPWPGTPICSASQAG